MPVWRDKDGLIIQNSAKGPLPRPQIEPVSIGVIRATVRKQSYAGSDYKSQLNSVNAGSWGPWGEAQAWCAGIRTKEVNEGNVESTLVRYTVLCCEYGWKSIAPDLGYYFINADSKAEVFTDVNGLPFLGCLDGAGAKQPVSSDINLLEKAIKRPVSFSFLGFNP